MVDGESVVVDKVSGAVHHLNSTASFIWSQLDGTTSTAVVAERVAASFEVDSGVASGDVQRLVEQFQALRLLEHIDGVEEK